MAANGSMLVKKCRLRGRRNGPKEANRWQGRQRMSAAGNRWGPPPLRGAGPGVGGVGASRPRGPPTRRRRGGGGIHVRQTRPTCPPPCLPCCRGEAGGRASFEARGLTLSHPPSALSSQGSVGECLSFLHIPAFSVCPLGITSNIFFMSVYRQLQHFFLIFHKKSFRHSVVKLMFFSDLFLMCSAAFLSHVFCIVFPRFFFLASFINVLVILYCYHCRTT